MPSISVKWNGKKNFSSLVVVVVLSAAFLVVCLSQTVSGWRMHLRGLNVADAIQAQ